MSDTFTTDLHRAVADVCQRHEFGLLSRLMLIAEVVDDGGELGLLIGTSPKDMPRWDRVGLLQFALTDVATPSVDSDEGDDL
ncbi:hypothetical protein ACQ86D_27815 [Streptomyces galilaeus]